MASTSTAALTDIEVPDGLRHIASGKVRELYEVDADTLLFVATDRISAYDVILENGIPGKGELLTRMTRFWLRLLSARVSSLKTHLISTSLQDGLSPVLANRSMQVKRAKVLPIESIVRGYLTGSAWSEYTGKGTVHGIPLPAGLRESCRLPSPLWTPSTKADAGEHDENISPEAATKILGDQQLADRVAKLSIELYEQAASYAWDRGIIIADTKFEFGLLRADQGSIDKGDQLILIDEVLTPDSSRFWPRDGYQEGRPQMSFDKQFLRDWLTSEGLKGKQGVSMTDEVVKKTGEKYREAFERLVGKEGAESVVAV